MDHLEFEKIEKKWQKKWEESRIFEADEKSKKQKFYILSCHFDFLFLIFDICSMEQL